MDDQWRQRIRNTWIGLGKLTIGAGIMAMAISNAEHSVWALPQFALGGAIVTQGFLHLSVAWSPADDPPGNGNAPRVGIPLAENERGDPDLAGEGLILHQNFPPIVDRVRDVAEANLHNEGEARAAYFVVGGSRAGSGGLMRREPVQQVIVHERDQEIDDNEFDLGNALEAVGQVNALEEVGQAIALVEVDQVEEESGHRVGELVQDTDESANVANESGLSKNVGEAEPAYDVNVAGQASSIGEVNMADSLEDISECADKDNASDACESEIELPRSSKGLSLDIPSIKFIDSSESDCESSY